VFPWRKRNEEFEWREYVRTTILFRRNERKRRVEEAKAAAVFGVRQASRHGLYAAAGHARTGAKGFAAACVWTWHALRWLAGKCASGGAKGASRALQTLKTAAKKIVIWSRAAAAQTVTFLRPVLSRCVEMVGSALAPVFTFLSQSHIVLPIALITCVTSLSAAHRIWNHGLDTHGMTAALVALMGALLILIPRLAMRPSRGTRITEGLGERLVLLPGFDRLAPRTAVVLSLGLLAGAATGGTWWMTRPDTNVRPLTTASISDKSILQGRARALSGDTIRISGTNVALDGIEAPERAQRCTRKKRRWNCGRTARNALARAIHRQRVVCEKTGQDASGLIVANCTAKGRDLAAKLVKKGHVFATTGLFAPYRSEEAEAKEKKLGLWSGKAERPGDYRDKRWNAAKSKAPKGCPIKGRVASGSRIYLLPWSRSYDRVKIRRSRGERWFCSEDEALAAGWRPVAPS
jgi:endonuclease YncB( thermonuclease family)